MCGADRALQTRLNTNTGSTPRVRSRLLQLHGRPVEPGINPARAEQVVALYCVPALASGTQYSIRSLQSP